MLIIINVVPAILAKREQKSEIKGHHVVLPAALLAVLIIAVTVFGKMGGGDSALPYAGETLYVYMPGEYIGENIVSDFEEQTGASVVMENFDSNEQMYIKVANGESYDILIPSDYMIQRLVEEDFLQELDQNKLTCMDLLNDAVKDMPFDPGNKYSISYFWGTVGIVYDKTVVDYADLEAEGFDIFLDTKYKGDIYLYDSERDSFMMALKALGYSMNTENEAELNEAYKWLEQCVTTMEPEIVMDEIIDNMAQARKALGICYSGDAAYIMSENENMGFYLPESGTNQWSDAMVIPKNAKNPDLAHEFMNFISSYDFAYDNSSYVGYTSPNVEVMNDLAASDYEGINAYLPRIGYEKDEVFVYNEQTRKIISNLWSKIKIVASNAQ
jgi:spermidine/putrescine transport system permease protein